MRPDRVRSELLVHTGVDGRPTALTSTIGPFAHALAFNAADAETKITARKDGLTFLPHVVIVTGGAFNTLAVIHAVE